MMESDVRTWQGGMEGHERGHYVESEPQGWTGHGMDMSKQSYYSTYPATSTDRPTYYTNHTHALNSDMTSCDPTIYTNTQIVPISTMTSPHGVYDAHQHFPAGPSAEMEHWHLQMLSQTDPFIALPIRDGPTKRKRRRVISFEQRKAANIRERRRMYQLNDAFDGLRKRVPTFAYEKKLSRIETLKLAVTYIEFMAEILENNGKKCKELVKKAKSKDGDNSISLVSDDDSLVVPNNDVTSETHSPRQSAGEKELCDHSENESDDD